MSPGRLAVVSLAAVAVVVARMAGSGAGDDGGSGARSSTPADAFTDDPRQIEGVHLSISSFS